MQENRSSSRRWPFLLAAMAGAIALAGCTSGGKVQSASASASAAVKPAVAAASPAVVRQPGRYRPRNPPPVQSLPGVQGVIGASAADLLRQFGPARLDVWEGDARKLQFIGPACVLDIYLYPGETSREPQASFVDARRPSDGQDVDRAACIAALRGK